MKKIAFSLAAFALLLQSAASAESGLGMAEDVADVTMRVCYRLAKGEVRWNPADLQEESQVLRSFGLMPGIPSGVIDSFGPRTAATFNRAILASRVSGAGHVLLAVGGMMPGCRVSVAGAPGIVSAADVTSALTHIRHGWTFVPGMTSNKGAIERRTFLKREEGGQTMMLDLLVVTEPSGTFRLMAMLMKPPQGLKLPPGF